MKNLRNRVLATGLVVMMILSQFMGTSALADAKASFSKAKVTVEVGKTKSIKVRNAGKKEGKAKLQIKTRGEKIICRITVKKKSNATETGGSKLR